MIPLVIVVAALIVVVGIGAMVVAGSRQPGSPVPGQGATPDLTEAQSEARRVISEARIDALNMREAALDELAVRRSAVDMLESVLTERDRSARERRRVFDERRHAHKTRRAEFATQQEALADDRRRAAGIVAEKAGLDRPQAEIAVLERIDEELGTEHAERVARVVEARIIDTTEIARNVISTAIERQDGSNIDSAPRGTPLPLDGLDDNARERLLTALGALAERTATEVGVDSERAQVSLRGIDPIGREVARQASQEIADRRLNAADVPMLVTRSRRSLTRKITDLGERALWEMDMGGRPELAELVGTLNYRFSFGQNALLHCQETGYLCGVLAAELGLDPRLARHAGMLHDIGKAVDHDVEGSHAIIGGELLRLFGTDPGIIHAVKAHHFEEEPQTDFAFLTICADAISASRPGARRDTIATYLARLEQLQTIATRRPGVERAFPLQAGREVRVIVKPKTVKDAGVAELSIAIARDIEAEMTYPGVIKVTVIRESTATATAPAQVVAPTRSKPTNGAEVPVDADVSPEAAAKPTAQASS